MNFKQIKTYTFLFCITTLIQCQAKPEIKEVLANGNYRELTELIKNSSQISDGVSFVASAAISTPCVVHIKTKSSVTINNQHQFQGFFGFDFYSQPQTQRQEGSGSGVIISEDGYIATNYHVIQNAQDIEVTLRNKNTYKAKVIGQDKETDMALLKIEEKSLSSIQFANSDKVMVGEWVLAVGNPFNLESTVTQGIVSAKGRSLHPGGIKPDGSQPIESFIQTDAAVNPGNSGGALVNLKGELIGINTAIASPTGAYAGYAFAVPSNLVKKVITDLKKYGQVQRAILGISSEQLTSEKAKELKLLSPSGVLVRMIHSGSSAEQAGLKINDVITKVNDEDISSFPELLEKIATYSPGDKVEISYMRLGEKKSTSAVLKNKNNNTDILKQDLTLIKKLGVKLTSLSDKEHQYYRLNYGVKVTEILSGIIAESTEIKPGFIILTVNELQVKSEADISSILQSKSNQIISIEGFYPNSHYIYKFNIKL